MKNQGFDALRRYVCKK